MNVFRVARACDIDAILEVSSQAGQGLTTVPKTREAVKSYILSTEQFIAGDPNASSVLFVLEADGVIVGISGVILQANAKCPVLSFEHRKRADLPTNHDYGYDTLKLSSRFSAHAMLGTLFLSPKFQGQGMGRLLSLGRLAFINSHRQSFKDNLMADIRGWRNAKGISPFWSGFSSKFFDVTLEQAEELSATDCEFLSNALPSSPIHLDLLEDAVLSCIGKPNDGSIGAVKLLCSAGFLKRNFCNVLDGGPALECSTSSTVVAQTERIAAHFSDETLFEPALHYSGAGFGFRAIISKADIGNATVSNKILSSFPDFESSPIKLSKLSLAASAESNIFPKQKVMSHAC